MAAKRSKGGVDVPTFQPGPPSEPPTFQPAPPSFQPAIGWRPPPGRKRNVAIVLVIVAVVLLAGLFAAIANLGQQQASFSAVNKELYETSANLTRSVELFDASDLDGSEAAILGAQENLAEAYAAYNANTALIADKDRSAFLDSLVLNRDLAQAFLDRVRLFRQFVELNDQYANATAADLQSFYPEWEILGEGLDHIADEFEEVSNQMIAILRDRPASSQYIGLTIDTAVAYRDAAHDLRGAAKDILTVIQREADDGNYQPVKQRDFSPVVGPAPESEFFTPEVKALFARFDEDKNQKITLGEAQAFYEWVEQWVIYRYDDEDKQNPYPGLDVGDGRPGPDYQQTPHETITERRGDCEDMNGLEVAFYSYWGISAFQALVNAESAPGTVDHAIAIVYVGDSKDNATARVGRLDTYRFEAGNDWNVPAGYYMIVDNAYSDAFGYISGGIEAGTFQIMMVRSLGGVFDQRID